MSDLRFASSTEIATVLGGEFIVIASGSDDQSSEALLTQFRDLAEAKRSAGSTAGWALSVLLVTKVYGPEADLVLRMLQAVNGYCERWPMLACEVAVLTLLPGFATGLETKKEDAARARAKAAVDALEKAAADLTHIERMDVWLVDGVDAMGNRSVEEDVVPLFARFLDSVPRTVLGPQAGNHMSAGLRALVFPRAAILKHLGNWYTKEVLGRETWLNASPDLQQSRVAMECGDFIDTSVLPGIERLDKNEMGVPLVTRPVMPALLPSEPLSTMMMKLKEPVDSLIKKDLERVAAGLAQNQGTLQVHLCESLLSTANGMIDERDERVVAARAFLEVLLNSASKLVHGESIDVARPRTLAAAFAPAIVFLDAETGFDPAQRQQLESSRALVARQTDHVEELRTELGRLETGQSTAPSKDGRVQTLREALATAETSLGTEVETLDGLERVVSEHDLTLENPATREALWPDVMAKVDDVIAKAAEALAKQKAVYDDASAKLAAAQEAARQLGFRLVFRFALAVVGAVVGGIIAGLVAGSSLATVPVAGPLLFGLFGGVFTAVAMQIYLLIAVVSLVILGVFLIMQYLASRKAVEKAAALLRGAAAVLNTMMIEYWQAYLQKFNKRCEWMLSARVFETERAVRRYAEDSLMRPLQQFEESLRSLLSDSRNAVAAFSPQIGEREVCVVGPEFLQKLIDEKTTQIEAFAVKFLADRGLSTYWQAFARDGVIDTLVMDLQTQCSSEIFERVQSMNVCDALEMPGNAFDAVAAAAQTPMLIPLMPNTSLAYSWIVTGPEADCVDSLAKAMRPPGQGKVVNDPERVTIVKMSSDIAAEQVVDLHSTK